MNPQQIDAVRRSFARLAPHAGQFATVFYNRLFAARPVLRLLFPADLDEQKKKLAATLALAVKTLDEPEKLVPVLENLGRRHALYGVRDEYYEPVGAALIAALDAELGAAFTPETRAAWCALYATVAATMQRAAAEMAASA